MPEGIVCGVVFLDVVGTRGVIILEELTMKSPFTHFTHFTHLTHLVEMIQM
jgi:hypothetical protein